MAAADQEPRARLNPAGDVGPGGAGRGEGAPADRRSSAAVTDVIRRLRVPAPMAVRHVNAWLLVGEPLTLVDGGPDTPSAYAAVRDGLAKAGCGIADLERIVLTHAHIDHCGLAARLQSESSAQVLAHPRAIADLRDWPATWAARLALVRRAARAGAVPTAVLEAYLDHAGPMVGLGASLPPARMSPLADGQKPLLAGSRWRALHTPGHSRDHLSLHDERSRDLVAGDLLLRHLPSPPLLEPRGADGARPDTLASLIASWRRIGGLDISVVRPGHGPSLRAHRVQLARRLSDTRDGVRAARRALRDGATTIWDVARHTDLPLAPDRLALTLGWSVARLDWLVSRGLAIRRLDGEWLRFESTSPRRHEGRRRRR